ncbi:uncharacterized protein LOC106177231 [Lingula anatina]|uniref:Uncharacterized protein LOC106177231 n=1 Tax=Lingula anatina TaxID=7574 RepID=A0A1S3JZE9_LINAN|nr:uncharacterized protein LOC106177231 [Lingula anatina]|eukprot:XP_013415406.1 uncharacterized protein LOC106177231 [Lingula anatina]
MTKFSSVAILLVVCWVSIDTTSAVKCYLCTNCADKNPSETTECLYGCATTKVNTSVYLGCAFDVTNGCKNETLDGRKARVCVCSGELCNGSPTVPSSATVSSSLLLLGLMSTFAAFLLGKM